MWLYVIWSGIMASPANNEQVSRLAVDWVSSAQDWVPSVQKICKLKSESR